ncbi:MAG TPA: hypothetical protein PLX05_03760 [Acinetobacter parvus]|jgi:hypothetical protein|uniref:hypothetical protein n=1 Tax=Acinetobacter TaxID=469 RepID=UPI00166143FA|nr:MULTISPECIES: hypothetical protein [Acinetobacter]MBD0448595.1 hypothetical protein [Acinetobacter baumannii]HRM14753.1 hypothetical protein [Acinetobacter parvus]HRM89802.1 hypothetical protein [Thomasclavelia ramosa]
MEHRKALKLMGKKISFIFNNETRIQHSFYWEVWGLLSEIGDHVVSDEDLRKIKAMNAEFIG